MKVCKAAKNPNLPTLYFFDFETRKDDEGYMIPFYAVIQKVCQLCDEKPFVKNYEHFLPHPEDATCDISVECVPCCGYRQYVLEKQNDCITKQFVDFMYAQPKNSVWIAHNGGRFDTVFLLRELLVERKIVPQCIMNGNKIMCMELEDRNLKVLDSFLFLNMGLKKFPEALGIPDICKGFHPYLFYDLYYVGPMVGLEYFDPPSEGSEERKVFYVWYEQQKKKPYIFREAMYYYCRLDVDILRQGCIIFAQLIKNITNVFPFFDKTCHTIAGLALKVYRTNFLNEETIGQIPAQGYGGNIKQSIIALYWLRELESDLGGVTLYSKLHPDGEQSIAGHYVDGYCPETRTIYQFHGCFFHGCKECYNGEMFNNVVSETFYTLRERTRRITEKFESQGYTVVEMWECDFLAVNKLTKKTIAMLREKDFFINTNLNPRDALFGGRVSPAVMCTNACEKKIRYYDFTSLYPYVQKINVFPVKHPEIVRGVEKCSKLNLGFVFGLIKCKILPPRNLLFPVIPYRTTKLTFPLCRTCADNLCDVCTHNEEERVLYGTWTSIEIHVALKHGYMVKEVYEVYNYKQREKIFDTYVNTFMKLKQESSGLPKNCYDIHGNVDEEKVNKYVGEYFRHEGVQLDASKISYNPGQRTVMKALLNSLWGKLAQNENVPVISFVDRFDDLLEMVNDLSIEVTSLDFISDDVARTTHRKVSSLIAAFVTAYARLELFKVLHKLGEDVLYYDTDSVIYDWASTLNKLIVNELLAHIWSIFTLAAEVSTGKHDRQLVLRVGSLKTGFMAGMLSRIVDVGGLNIRVNVHNVMHRLTNNEVMASMNMKGKGSKYAFGSTKVFQVVVGM
ncbi:DNA polymerase [Paramuricea clavata]|uniref:DNA-directed DNA polymerase n=1 Tax=Paramuricea clavata TaxID=317549 RepID=A0A6S7FLF3_PARCT|nr:DNA polymerase [Paramuricea clavata]